MKDKGIVVEIKDGNITVIPIITDSCISCNSPCGKRGNPFSVSNRKNFDVKVGSVVKIGASKAAQSIQGIVALLFPVLCSVLGYVLSPYILKNPDVSEGKRAAFVLASLFVSAILVYIFSRTNKKILKSEILEVYSR